MPGPTPAPPTPKWADPRQASVFDSPVERALRALSSVLGGSDPVSDLSSPLDVPGTPGGLVGMALRKTALKPIERFVREFAAHMMLFRGDATKAMRATNTAGLRMGELDVALQRGLARWEALSRGADPAMFNLDRQRRLIEAGMPGADFYVRSRRGMTHVMGDDPLMPALTSLTSSQDTPYGNAAKALAVRASVGAGKSPAEAAKLSGMGSVETGVGRLLAGEMPFNERKTLNFWQNLQGNPQAFTTDSWEGRGLGFSVYDPRTPVEAKAKDPLTGKRKVVQGGWVEWPRSTQANQGNVVRPLQQPAGIPPEFQIDLIEDVIGKMLGPEFGLDPAATQAAHWAGIQQYFGDKKAPYLKAPYDQQFLSRLTEWGIPPKAPGEAFTTDEWLQMLDEILRDKATPSHKRRKYGKGW